MARLLAIYLRPAARLPVKSVDTAVARTDAGLEGDHGVSGKRQVTILSRESWDAACRELDRDLDPSVRRANLLVEGLDLGQTIGKTRRIGPVIIDVLGETRPCELLDDDGRVGLNEALRSDRRGGVFGKIRSGGPLKVGDPCADHDDASDAPPR